MTLGVVLAGGRGRRLGGAKPTVWLAGRPLIAYPLDALRAGLGDPGGVPGRAAIAVKRDTPLPRLPAGVAVWREPFAHYHALQALVHALERAGGRPVVVCPVDLPLVGPEVIGKLAERLARERATGGRAVLARGDGRAQPLLGAYAPEAAPVLRECLDADPNVSVGVAVARLDPAEVEVGAGRLLNVNTPADLERAESRLG